MRHFIAYHNTEKMGRPLHDGEPLRLLTNKPVEHLRDNTVWFVTGEGEGTRQYSLGSVFRVAHVGEAPEDGFQRFATGVGHVFQPPVPIKELGWFLEVLRATGNFGFGVQEIKNEAVISGLTQLATQGGYEVAASAPSTESDPIATQTEPRRYPEPKQRELGEEEKQQMRDLIEQGEANIYILAKKFGCTSSQVAGIKAAMNR